MELLFGAVFVAPVSRFSMIQTIEVNKIQLRFDDLYNCPGLL